MKVKIGRAIFDANDQPIMLILNKHEKKQIANMDENAMRYCQYPDHLDTDWIEVWMDILPEEVMKELEDNNA